MPQQIMMCIVHFRTKLINIFMILCTIFHLSRDQKGIDGTVFYSQYKNRVGGALCFIREDFQLINYEFLQC